MYDYDNGASLQQCADMVCYYASQLRFWIDAKNSLLCQLNQVGDRNLEIDWTDDKTLCAIIDLVEDRMLAEKNPLDCIWVEEVDSAGGESDRRT